VAYDVPAWVDLEGVNDAECRRRETVFTAMMLVVVVVRA
jgi:hypothetical protein